jgi:3-oxoacyl-[acyl-carrier protein] reductase
LAIAQRLLRADYDVVMNYAHDADAAAAVLREINHTYPGRATMVRADLSTTEGLQALAQAVEEAGQPLDHLVCNAGATARGRFQDMTFDGWNRVLATNLTVPLFLVQRLLPLLREGSSVLFISSLLGLTPHATSLPYGVTKAAIAYAARALVKDLAGAGVRVNAVAPGFVDTPWQADKPPEVRARIENKIALGRFARPEEVAEFCFGVLENAYVNGGVLTIDGGYDYW